MTRCPRCSARAVRNVTHWECLTHGQILSEAEQQEIDRWKRTNSAKGGDTRGLRGGFSQQKGLEMASSTYGYGATYLPEKKNNNREHEPREYVTTPYGRGHVLTGIKVRAVRDVSEGYGVCASAVDMRTTDAQHDSQSEGLFLSSGIFAWGEGQSAHRRRKRAGTSSRHTLHRPIRVGDGTGRGQLRLAI